MNLLDKYVEEIGKGLPRRNRLDIEREIRSTLQDMLDERAARAGKPADDEMVRALLKEYGAPAKVAASYGPPQYLIGPRIFPVFLLVTRIVLAVLLAVSLAGLGLSLARTPGGPDVIRELGKFGLQLFGALISAFGNIVIVFAILERVLPASKFEQREEEEEWDPAQLAAEPDPAEVKPAEPIVAILVTVIALVVLNLYPDLVGIGFVSQGRWTTVPALSDAFFRYMPWINLLGVLQIGLNLVLLRRGRWNTDSRIANLVLDVCGIVLAGVMLAGPSLVDLTTEKLAATPLGAAGAQLAPLLSMLPRMVLTIIVIVSAVEVGQGAYKLLKRPALLYPAK